MRHYTFHVTTNAAACKLSTFPANKQTTTSLPINSTLKTPRPSKKLAAAAFRQPPAFKIHFLKPYLYTLSFNVPGTQPPPQPRNLPPHTHSSIAAALYYILSTPRACLRASRVNYGHL